MGSDRTILVLGDAREGKSVARFLAGSGSRVTISDRSISDRAWRDGICLQPESQTAVSTFDAVLVSPGIPSSNPVLAEAQSRGVLITNATQLFLELCPCPVVGVTGSHGKSTTTSLVAAILRAAGRAPHLGGNIGNPMLDLLDGLGPDHVAIIEMSSFQLERVSISPHVAVITNLSPNHLDRHGSMAAYADAKRRILAFQSDNDYAIVNVDSIDAWNLTKGTLASKMAYGWDQTSESVAFADDGEIVRIVEGGVEPVLPISELRLPGRHNAENALAAIAATTAIGVSNEPLRSALSTFEGLPHRLEHVADFDGVQYVDDSIATSPERVAVALDAASHPVILVAGGRSKHLPWQPALDAGRGRVRAVVAVGEAAAEVEQVALGPDGWPGVTVVFADSISEAVDLARGLARSGDCVLLSPGCTSYDQFTDFEARGHAFQAAVHAMVD